MSTDMVFYVYEHWRLDRDECFYVGKGHGKRAYSIKNRNQHWNNIVLKLERIGSGYEIRLVATGISEQDAFSLEKERISFWRDLVDLANICDGGEGVSGLKHSEETKKLWSEKRKGCPVSIEGRIKRSKTMKGVPKSKEHAAKAGAAGGFARKGMKHSEEHKKAIGSSLLNSEKFKSANKARRKTIICLNSGQIFSGLDEAAIANNVSRYAVHDCCSGRTKHTKDGLVFKYEDA